MVATRTPPAPSHLRAGGRAAPVAAIAGRARRPVHHAVLAATAALLLAALLDAEALQDTASQQPFGWRRDVALALAEPLVDVSRALHLGAPRRWLESTFDRPTTRRDPAAPDPPTTTTTAVPPPTGSTATTNPPATTTTQPHRRLPTTDAPLRLLFAGDSMTEAAGPALLDAADALGVVAAEHELRYSSGLTRPDYFDWPAHLSMLLTELDPEAVVVFIGANDAQGIETAAGPVSFRSEAWVTEYRSRVAATMDLLTADGRLVYWVGQPVMRPDGYDDRMRTLTEIYRSEAERHPGVRFVETRLAFAGPDGGYTAYLPDAAGHPVLVRRDDGIHLTPAGAERLVALLLDALRQDWALP